MSTNYSGNPGNVTTPLSRTITNVTSSGGLCLVTTSINHLFGDQDIVAIGAVTGTGGLPAAVNGTWAITVVSANTFTLNGSTFAGAYTSGGTVVDYSCTPYFQVPSDGDSPTAESVLSAFQALADRTAFIQKNTLGIRFASLAAAAAAPLPAKIPFFVVGDGWWYFDPASSASVDGVTVAAAFNSSGRLLSAFQAFANTNPGIPIIGGAGASSGRILSGIVPNAIIKSDSTFFASGSPFTTTSTSYVEVFSFSGNSQTISAQVGDVFAITLGGVIGVAADGGGAATATFALSVVNNAVISQRLSAIAGVPASGEFFSTASLVHIFTVTAVPFDIKMEAKTTAHGTGIVPQAGTVGTMTGTLFQLGGTTAISYVQYRP